MGVLFVLAASLILWSSRHRLWGLSLSVSAVALVVAGLVYVHADVFLRTMNTYHYPSKIVFMNDGVTGEPSRFTICRTATA